MEITKPPRDVRYSQHHGEVYERLKMDRLSPFFGALYKDIFMYAMAYGFRHGLQEPLDKPQRNIPLSSFSEEEKWIVKAIAIAEKGSLEILADERQVYEVAERYANGALDTIHAEVLGGKLGEPYKRMAQDVVEESKRFVRKAFKLSE